VVVILKNNVTEAQIEDIKKHLEDYGFQVHESRGEAKTILGAIGVNPGFDIRKIKILDGVTDVYRVTAPYKMASRNFKEENTIIKIGDVEIGSNEIILMAGPCSVESEDQIFRLAKVVAESGSKVLRGGAFKPRTSPYSFQGLGLEGLQLLSKMRDEHGFSIVSEVRDSTHVDEVIEHADVIQIGAKSMYDHGILKACAKTNKTVLIKRGFGTTLQEFVQAAEFVLSGGNENVLLCERGIRTFETKTRFTLDLCGVAWLKEYTNLPVILDPSHALGYRYGIADLTKACVAMGVDGLLIEVHPNPAVAKSDAAQQLYHDQFRDLMKAIKPVAEAVGRRIV